MTARSFALEELIRRAQLIGYDGIQLWVEEGRYYAACFKDDDGIFWVGTDGKDHTDACTGDRADDALAKLASLLPDRS